MLLKHQEEYHELLKLSHLHQEKIQNQAMIEPSHLFLLPLGTSSCVPSCLVFLPTTHNTPNSARQADLHVSHKLWILVPRTHPQDFQDVRSTTTFDNRTPTYRISDHYKKKKKTYMTFFFLAEFNKPDHEDVFSFRPNYGWVDKHPLLFRCL